MIIKTNRGVFYSLILLLIRRSSTSTNVKLVALVIGIFFGCWCTKIKKPVKSSKKPANEQVQRQFLKTSNVPV